MRLVIDASVVVEACIGAAAFQPLDGHELVAPPLLWSEASSVLHEMSWRGEIEPDVATEAVERLEQAPITRRDLEGGIRATWAIADGLGWAKTYDAEYIALAQELSAPLLTIDDRLRRGVGKTIRVVGPMDLSEA